MILGKHGTVVVFSFWRISNLEPEVTANETLGAHEVSVDGNISIRQNLAQPDVMYASSVLDQPDALDLDRIAVLPHQLIERRQAVGGLEFSVRQQQ